MELSSVIQLSPGNDCSVLVEGAGTRGQTGPDQPLNPEAITLKIRTRHEIQFGDRRRGLTWRQTVSEPRRGSSSPSGCAPPACCPPRASSWWPSARRWRPCPASSPAGGSNQPTGTSQQTRGLRQQPSSSCIMISPAPPARTRPPPAWRWPPGGRRVWTPRTWTPSPSGRSRRRTAAGSGGATPTSSCKVDGNVNAGVNMEETPPPPPPSAATWHVSSCRPGRAWPRSLGGASAARWRFPPSDRMS